MFTFYTMSYLQHFYNYTIENWTQKERREPKLWFLCKPSVLCVIASFPRFNLIFWFFARLNTCIFALTLGMFCLIFKPEEPKWVSLIAIISIFKSTVTFFVQYFKEKVLYAFPKLIVHNFYLLLWFRFLKHIILFHKHITNNQNL